MKKILILGVLFMCVLMAPLAAQEVEPPDNVLDVITHLDMYLGSLAGLAAVAAFFSAMVNGFLKVTKGLVKQLVAWGVSIVIIVAADIANFGFVADFPIIKAVVYGLGAGLIANGIFDIPFIKTILDKVEGWFPKPKPEVK